MEPTSLHSNIIYQAGSFTKIFQDQMRSEFRNAGFNVTNEQFSILAQLWYQDGISQQDIASVVGRDKTTVSRVIDNMIKNNLIRKTTGSDKRQRLIYLTEHGKSVQHQLVTISGNLYMKAINDIPSSELLQAINVLTKMTNNLT